MTAAEIAHALGAASKTAAGWCCRCPAHAPDKHPSLYIDERGGRVLWICRAGCTQDTVTAALRNRGLLNGTAPQVARQPKPAKRPPRLFANSPEQAADMFAQWQIKKGYEVVAVHAYADADGTPLFWRLRCKHRSKAKWIAPFRVTGRTGDTGDEYELAEPKFPGGGKPLYGLPALAEASDAPVLLVEGETCADALVARGLIATTSGSTTSAHGADWGPLMGRECIIWPDNDQPGRKYADAVTAELRAVGAAYVHVVDVDALELPEKGDCVNWLSNHPEATADDVLALATIKPPGAAKSLPANNGLVITCFYDIEPEPIAWLWPGRIAIGRLTMLVGDPGLGKSLVTIAIAAAVSNGATWPVDGGTAPVGDVLLLSAEDDPGDTIRPRLDAAGANVQSVHVIEAARHVDVDGNIRESPFSLADDLPALEIELAKLPDCRLVVVDPITAYLGGTDSHKNAELRALLAPLADLARHCKVALLLVSHLNKADGKNPMYRTMGSLAFVAAARAVHVVSKDKDDPRRRLILPVKNNLAPDTEGLAYSVNTASNGAPVVCWEPDAVTLTAEDVLSTEPDNADSKRREAVNWLVKELAAGPVKSTELRQRAEDAGHAWRTVNRAKDKLGIVVEKVGFSGGCWRWRLDANETEEYQKAPSQNVAGFEKCGSLRDKKTCGVLS